MRRFKRSGVLWMSILAFFLLSTGAVRADDLLEPQSGEEQIQSGDYTYSFVSSFLYPELAGTISIENYHGTESAVWIPSTLNDLTVTSIGPESFTGSSLEKVLIPKSVALAPINWIYGVITSPFSECSNLRYISFEEGTTKIPSQICWNCKSLQTAYFPGSAASVGENAFRGCSNLTKAYIPASVETIPYNAFYGCTNLTIYGEAGSYAETFANTYGFPFSTYSPQAQDVMLNASSISLPKGASRTLTAEILPPKASQDVFWSTSDPEIATVSDGTVTAKKAGTAIITARTENNLTASCTVHVTTPDASGISLNKTTLTLLKGNAETLTASVQPSDASQTVSWSSSDPSIATVSDGKVEAVSVGSAIIKAKTSNGKTASCTVTVTLRHADSISLNKNDLTLVKGSSETLTASILPSDASQAVSWSSSDPKIALVSDGKITGIDAGSATITAKTSNGQSASCRVTVSLPEADSVSLNKFNLTIVKGNSETITASVLPSDASQTVSWSSSDPSIATVSDGKIEAVSVGSATITAKTPNGKSASCIVTVSLPEANSVSLNKNDLTLVKGNSETITASVLPSDASQTVYWSSSDPSIATVSDGKVEAVSVGSATITAKTPNGKSASCTVTVKLPDAVLISLNPTSLKLEIGGSARLSATVSPAGASQSVSWSSSNPSVATVSGGTVSAVAAGTATITAKTSNGKSAACQVTVNKTEEDQVPIYRLYLPATGEHLYTSDYNEYKTLYQLYGWGQEGVAWYAPSSGTAVYRLYHPGLKNHLYTTDANEVKVLTAKYGWRQDNGEKPLYYSGGEVPIYRVYNAGLNGMHHLTTDTNEYQILPKYGWKQEGVKLKAVRIGSPITTRFYK